MQACLLSVTLFYRSEIKMNGDSSSKPHKFSLQYLKEITNNFSDKLEIGRGGFGVVYKGIQANGGIVAVKKLLHSIPSSLQQFENEVDLLMRLEHPNIVQLVGYCYEIQNEYVPFNGKCVFAGEADTLLCLEYLPNGSLDRFISDRDKFSRVDWHTRYKIIEGTCNGLQYLHKQTNGPIIHLDLKPANILLTDALVPKITDFGLSRLLDRQQTMCTIIVGGTLGYMPPEFLQGVLTPSWDMFSLGVIILEIITGERKYPDDIGSCPEEFIEFELEKWRDTLQKEPGYKSLEIDCEQIKTCIEIGLLCMNPLRAKRPTITKIIEILQGLEGADWNISNEEMSPAAQIRSGPRKLLDVYPRQLSFSMEPDKSIRSIIKLNNETDECIAFHFKVTRAENLYRIEPAGGFLWPRAMTHVIVTLEKKSELLQPEFQGNDEFLVQSIVVREDRVTSKGNDEFLVQSIVVREDRVTSKHIPEHTFNKMPSNAVHKVKLLVSRVSLVQASEPQVVNPGEPVPEEETDLASSSHAADDFINKFRKQDTEVVDGARPSRPLVVADPEPEEADDEVEARANEFINKFRHQLKVQRIDSYMRYRDTLRHGRATAGQYEERVNPEEKSSEDG